jgi:hypothetical protein
MMNELPYILLKRNSEGEHIADNENFSRARSKCFMNKDLAITSLHKNFHSLIKL